MISAQPPAQANVRLAVPESLAGAAVGVRGEFGGHLPFLAGPSARRR